MDAEFRAVARRPRSPVPEVSTQIVLPRRQAAVRLRPVSAAPQFPLGMRPRHVAVGVVDVHDLAVQGPVGDQAAGSLNFG